MERTATRRAFTLQVACTPFTATHARYRRPSLILFSLDRVTHPFRPYEVAVLQALLADEFSRDQLSQILDDASDQHIESNGYGFYISVRHPAIGSARRVYSGPPSLAGHCEGRLAGFIVFLEQDQLTLEIYPWDDEGLPDTFRDGDVRIGP